MLITNACVVTMAPENRFLERHAVLIRDGKINQIGPSDEMAEHYPGEELLDARGKYLMPGNICAHTHFYGAFARGMGIPGPAPADFPQILKKLWWGLDKSLTLNDVYYSAIVCLIEAIKHGTTTLIDHHASPNAIDGSLDEIARAVMDTGVRASLCYEVTDRDGLDKAEQGIQENMRFYRHLQNSPDLHGRLAAMFGLHASLTLSEDTLRACRKAAGDEIGFHIHVAEHSVDEYDSLGKCGLRVVDRLERHGLLGPASIAAHAVHIDAKEIEILARTNTWVTHQPRSNMNNAVGMPQVESMMRAGVRVCLGNDGFFNAMWDEWKAAYLAHKLWNQDPRRMQADIIQNMAVYNNAALVSKILGGVEVGVIRPGAEADLILVDYHPFTLFNPGNLPWHIVFGFNESMITTTLVGGKVLMKDHHLTLIDEEKIMAQAKGVSSIVWDRYQAIMNGEVL
jgi:putative selenium metabolism protein SsnA